MYLRRSELEMFGRLLKTFFTLPYSTDLDGKDAETLLRIVKRSNEAASRRKELFDIVSGEAGYSVKTLRKSPNCDRVDLQEQRFCDVKTLEKLTRRQMGSDVGQGKIILSYMRDRITDEMRIRKVREARSLILLKWWNSNRDTFSFRYWEEDLLGYIDNLWKRNERNEIEWVFLEAGIHARDRLRKGPLGKNVRLLRMHHKHNQIFTDHDIPADADRIEFSTKPISWEKLAETLQIL